MTDNVTPEEKRALLEHAVPEAAEAAVAPAVLQRDFSEPRRYSTDELRDLTAAIERALPRLQQGARQVLGSDVLVRLTSLTEASADRLVESWKAPYALLRFRSRGQVCWFSMEPSDARAELERLLGSRPTREARALSGVERHLLILVARVLFEPLSEQLGFQMDDVRAVIEPDDIGNWRLGEGAPDPHRLTVELSIERGTERSLLRVHVPPPARTRKSAAEPPPSLVPHIQGVDLELAARLGALEIPVQDLLGLDVGDVLPLDAEIGSELRLYVNERPWASAVLGARGPRLAVALRDVIQATP